MIRKRDEYVLFKNGITGKIVNKIYKNPLLDMISRANLDHTSNILEVGCGNGNLLYSLNEIGFKNLIGLDPYITKEVIKNRVKIIKKSLHELSNDHKFDLIIFNHSFEHIPNQEVTLLKVRNMLSENGVCLIRMPVKTEFIWDHYDVNWIQIDAPRHYFIHTLKSFEFLVRKSDLFIQDMFFDSNEFQFWGSEQYKSNIPLNAKNSYSLDPKRSLFTRKQIREFIKLANKLNIEKRGDQATFYLKAE